MKSLQTIAMSLLLAGCSMHAECVKPAIGLPLEPVLPSIKASELQCIRDETHAKLVERDLLLKEYAEKCVVTLRKLTSEQQ